MNPYLFISALLGLLARSGHRCDGYCADPPERA
jgi:hypothetical protein